jgi:hypothetical protein
MDVQDLWLDIFSCLSKNEVEKMELVSKKLRRFKKNCAGYLKQQRIFSKLVLSRDLYRESLVGSCGALIDLIDSRCDGELVVYLNFFIENFVDCCHQTCICW